MDERRASAIVVGSVHSRATPASVNPPENGTIRREVENEPVCYSPPTGALFRRSTIPVDFGLRIWQVDLTIAPFLVILVVYSEVCVPAFVSCVLDQGTGGRCRGSTTGNV